MTTPAGWLLGIVLGALVALVVVWMVSRSAKVYDFGGMLPPGFSGANNHTGHDEIVKLVHQNTY